WLFGVPTGLILILLNRFIPESPRFLLARGRRAEAVEVMRSFGVVMTPRAQAPKPVSALQPSASLVWRSPYRGLPLALVVYGLAPDGAEVYPTSIRAAGAGSAAGASKLGGVLALGLSVASVSPPDLAGSALLAAAPASVAALMVLLFGLETRGRKLEEISPAV